MHRIITFMSALLFASAASASQLYVDAPRDGYLNLRAGPSTSYQVISKLKHGSPVHIIATPGKWYKVRDTYGSVGWAHSGYMSKHPKPAYETHFKPYKLYVNAPGHSGLNLRHGPGKQFPVLYTMGQGSRVKVLSASGKWFLVKHETGYQGWAHKSYLDAHKPYVNTHIPRQVSPLREPRPGSNHGSPLRELRHGAGISTQQLQQAILFCSQRPVHRRQRCLARHLGQF